MYDCPQCGPTPDTPDEHALRHSGSAGLVDQSGHPLAAVPTIPVRCIACSQPAPSLHINHPEPVPDGHCGMCRQPLPVVEAATDDVVYEARLELTIPADDVAMLVNAAAIAAGVVTSIGPDKLAEQLDDEHAAALKFWTGTTSPDALMAVIAKATNALTVGEAAAILTAADGLDRQDAV